MLKNGNQVNAVLRIKVVPKSRRNRVSVDDRIVKVHVSAPPEKGQANEAVLCALSQAFGVPTSTLEILCGAAWRNKSVRFAGITEDKLNRMIKEKIV